MYENIGGKIKSVAVGTFIVEAIVAVFSGVAIIFSGELVLIGLLVIIFGPLGAWVSSFLLYGFGELIERVCYISHHIGNPSNNSEEYIPTSYEDAAEYNHRHNLYNVSNKRKACSKCGNIVTERDTKCRCCGTEVKW